MMSMMIEPARGTVTLPVVRNWVLSKLGRIQHERRVSQVALELVAVTAPLHAITPSQRRVLRLGAFVHDVGRAKASKLHEHIGASMLKNSRSLKLGNRLRRALAYLTLYHRGNVPAMGDDAILKRSDDVAGLYLLLAFLRAADALDSRSLASPKLSFNLAGRRLQVRCELATDCARAKRVFARRKKFRLLEQLLGCRVEVDLRIAAQSSIAA